MVAVLSFLLFSGLFLVFEEVLFGLWRPMLGLLREPVGLREEPRSVRLEPPSPVNGSSFLSKLLSCSWKDLESGTLLKVDLLSRESLLEDNLISSSEESVKFCIFNNSLDGFLAILSLFLLSLLLDPDERSRSLPLLPESFVLRILSLLFRFGSVPP